MADLRGADLSHAIFIDANLSGTIFHEAQLGWTTFGDVDLSTGQGLDPTTQKGPSTLGVDTRYRSKGRIPDVFLRGAGVPGDFMPSIKSLVGRAFESYSCLISYASQDQEFAERLHADLQDKGATLAKGLCPLNFNH